MKSTFSTYLAVVGIFVFWCSRNIDAAAVVINEVMASNGETVVDEDGDFSDWIELYNAGAEPVNLAGWGLSDDPEQPFRWVLPQVVIDAGDYLLVWASGKDRRPVLGERANGILREVFLDIPGGAVSDLTAHPSYPDSPTSRHIVKDVFEVPQNIADHFGQRMHGWLLAPQTGNYRFWISGDNGSQLFLSSDENPDNAVMVAEIPGVSWSAPRQWNAFSQQTSAWIPLQAGQLYYICALMKEDVGGDHLAVRWQLPDYSIEEPIPADRMYMRPRELHANFSVDVDGEPLQLTTPDGTVADVLDPIELIRNVSFGRSADGANVWVYFAEPTPGSSNAAAVGYQGIMSAPQFSHTGGFYTDPFTLTLTTDDPEATLCYTLDGSRPTLDNLNGTSYGYKNQYPDGTMLYREYTTLRYEQPLTIDEHPVPLNTIAGINTENSGAPGTPESWTIEGDQLVQTSLGSNIRLMFGDPAWTDYELTCQALKDGGSEGFLIFFRAIGNHYYFVNYGGWNNTLHGIEKGRDDGSWGLFLDRVGGNVKTNQWYDIRVRCQGNHFQCWLDDNLVFDFHDNTAAQNLSGGVGLGTWITRSRYRNIEVRALDGTVLFSGMPSRTSRTTLIRARACKEGFIPSDIVTRSYFVDTPPVLRHNLPVLSLAADEPDIFGYEEGIYVAGRNRDMTGTPNYMLQGQTWERSLHFTLFEPDGSVGLMQNIGARIHGGWTRNLPQKALRLYARADYGRNDFEYPIFPDHPTERFKRLILRNSGNDNGQTFFRDAMMQRLVEHLPLDTQACRPAVVYLNGEYWGIHNFRERYDKFYLENKYGVDPDAVDILEYLPGTRHLVKEGDASHFDQTLGYIEANGLAAPEHYAYIQTRIDTDNFMDYNIAQIYFNNTDWPGNNNDWWRKRTDDYQPHTPYGHDGRWRWMLYDTDFGFGLSGGYNANTLAFATDGNTGNTGWPNPHWTTYLLRKLLENQAFRNDFINRYADLLNTAFLPARVVAVIDQMQAVIAPEMPNHIARWGRPGSVGDWNNQVNVMRSFADRRPGYARSHLREKFGLGADRTLTLNVSDAAHGYVRINRTDLTADTPGVNPVAPYPWTGTYFEGIPVTVRAVARPGYRFTHWTGSTGINPLAKMVTLPMTDDTELTAHFEQLPPRALMHYWSFNNAGTLLSPTYTISGGAFEVTLGPATEITTDTGEGFDGLNNRLDESTGMHLRVNDPLGSSLTLRLPTTGYEAVSLRVETRRSGRGAGTQLYAISTDGETFTPFEAIAVLDDGPVLHTFDFTDVPGAANNPEFAVRIEFEQGAGSTAGNNRFDNLSLEGIALEGTNQPPQASVPIPLVESLQNTSKLVDLNAYFSDPDDDTLSYSATVDKSFVTAVRTTGNFLTLLPVSAGDAVITITADDGVNMPIQASFRVLVYPAARPLRLGAFRFGQWSPDRPEHTFPDHMLFLQSRVSDPGLTEPLPDAYFIPHDDYHANDLDKIGYPYATTGRTRLNGLDDDGVSFINTGRGRDLGGALLAVDTTGLEGVRVGWTAATVTQNVRRYAIRLQYRIGYSTPFRDVTDNGQPVEYIVQTDGHTQLMPTVELPAEAVNRPYVQLLWRYYHVDGTEGARAQLRLDDIAVSGLSGLFDNVALFAQEWLRNDCRLPDYCGGADFDRDGRVDLDDFAILAAQWTVMP